MRSAEERRVCKWAPQSRWIGTVSTKLALSLEGVPCEVAEIKDLECC